jgi:hypothetical protein
LKPLLSGLDAFAARRRQEFADQALEREQLTGPATTWLVAEWQNGRMAKWPNAWAGWRTAATECGIKG